MIKYDDDSLGRVYITENFSDFNFNTSNNLMDFGYKLFRKNESQKINFVQIDA